MSLEGKRIMISRTDSIGDVLLTLPICSWLKEKHLKSSILFLGNTYTRPIVDLYSSVDSFVNWDDFSSLSKKEKLKKWKELDIDVIIHVFPNKKIAQLAKKAKTKIRVGTSHRLYHFWTCNKRVSFTRKKSDLHESQLNYELLRALGLKEIPSLNAIIKTTKFFSIPKVSLPNGLSTLTDLTVLHPKSKGSALEWPIDRYFELAGVLAKQGRIIVFTGTKSEGEIFKKEIPKHKNIIDATGLLSLSQLVLLISKAKNFVACSTGPLHIASYLGINTVGIYSSKRPIHPGRWGAIGSSVNNLVGDVDSSMKREDSVGLEGVSVKKVLEKIV